MKDIKNLIYKNTIYVVLLSCVAMANILPPQTPSVQKMNKKKNISTNNNEDAVSKKQIIYTKKNGKMTNEDIRESTITVKSNNAEQKINYKYKNGDKFHSKSDIMIKFNSVVNIQSIENKYNLKLKRKMNSGDYLFENISGNTLNIINEIVEDNTLDIQRITPNKILNIRLK
jgi:lipopolysaccharide export LptBFGC system permease protein LptF